MQKISKSFLIKRFTPLNLLPRICTIFRIYIPYFVCYLFNMKMMMQFLRIVIPSGRRMETLGYAKNKE